MSVATKKILAQSYPAAAVLTDAFKAPAKFVTVITSILITNHAGSHGFFSLTVALEGVADHAKHYFFKDCKILAGETMDLDLNLELDSKDVIRVHSSSGQISFNIIGTKKNLIS